MARKGPHGSSSQGFLPDLFFKDARPHDIVWQAERDLGNEDFGALPSPWFVEMSVIMLEHAKEAIGDSERVRQLVEQLLDLRRGKVMSGLATLTGPLVTVKLNNLTLSEINLLRPFMVPAMQQKDKIAAPSIAHQ